jgi:hypothetical protein
VTSLRYEFQQDSQGILRVTKDALSVLRILRLMTVDALAVKPSLEPAQGANSEFSL